MRHLKQFGTTAIIATVIFAIVGCQRSVNIPQGQVLQTPMPEDEAMQIRSWDRSVAYYQNPRFVAGNTGFWYETPYYPPQWWYAATDTLLFLTQTAGLPITLVVVPLWKPVEYAGETVQPTYHAMPPLPPVGYSAQEAAEYQSLPPAPPDEPQPAPAPIEPMPPVEPPSTPEPSVSPEQPPP